MWFNDLMVGSYHSSLSLQPFISVPWGDCDTDAIVLVFYFLHHLCQMGGAHCKTMWGKMPTLALAWWILDLCRNARSTSTAQCNLLSKRSGFVKDFVELYRHAVLVLTVLCFICLLLSRPTWVGTWGMPVVPYSVRAPKWKLVSTAADDLIEECFFYFF